MFATPLHHMAAEPLWNSSARLRRARRVGFLIIVLVGLSIIDLLLTLEYVRTIGMAELNPIAAWIMRQGSTAGLVAWKIGTVMMAATIIYSIRHRVRGEFAAWVCTLILTVLTAPLDQLWSAGSRDHARCRPVRGDRGRPLGGGRRVTPSGALSVPSCGTLKG
jgi:hypothetical protein